MKSIIISLALTCVITIAALPSIKLEENDRLHGIFDNILNNTINKIINNMSDPTVINDISLVLNQTVLDGSLNASNIYITGMKTLVASYIKVNIGNQTLQMTLNISQIALKLNYVADLLFVEIVPLYGAGLCSVDFTNVVIDISGTADLSNLSKIKIKVNEVLFTLGTAIFNVNGLLNNPEFSALVNVVLNDNLVDLINENNRLISKILGPIIETVINNALSGNSYEEYGY